jgi:hypothetical protein
VVSTQSTTRYTRAIFFFFFFFFGEEHYYSTIQKFHHNRQSTINNQSDYSNSTLTDCTSDEQRGNADIRLILAIALVVHALVWYLTKTKRSARSHLQSENSKQTGKTSAKVLDSGLVSCASCGSRRRASSRSGSSARGSRSRGRSTGTGRLGRAGSRASSRAGSAASSRGTSTSTTVLEGSLAAGEEAVDAGVDTLGEGLGGGRRSITLVALGGALVGGDGLRSVGAGVAQALGLAVDIASIAVQGALDGGCESSRHGSGGGGSAGDVLGEGASGEKEDGRVLHGVVVELGVA